MSCKNCEENSHEYPFRWGVATISVTACEKHAKEVLDALREANQFYNG